VPKEFWQQTIAVYLPKNYPKRRYRDFLSRDRITAHSQRAYFIGMITGVPAELNDPHIYAKLARPAFQTF